MEEQNIRIAIDRHWAASAAGDQVAEHEIYHDDIVCEYPQSGEVIRGRSNLQALRSHHPGRPSGFSVRRIEGKGNLWITEYVIIIQRQARLHREHYGVSRWKSVARNPILCRPIQRSCLARTVGRNGGGRQHLTMRSSEPRPVPTFSVTCFMESLLTRAVADLGLVRPPYGDRYLLHNATPSVFHQRHVGRVLRSSCKDSRTKTCIVTRSRTSIRPMPSSLAG